MAELDNVAGDWIGQSGFLFGSKTRAGRGEDVVELNWRAGIGERENEDTNDGAVFGNNLDPIVPQPPSTNAQEIQATKNENFSG